MIPQEARPASGEAMTRYGGGMGDAARRALERSLELETQAGELLRELFALQQLRRLRGGADPRVRDREEGFLRSVRQFGEDGGPLRIRRVGPHLSVNGVRVPADPAFRLALDSLRHDLERWGLGGFELVRPLPPAALDALLDLYPRLGDHLDAAAGPVAAPGGDAAVGAAWLPEGVRLLPPGDPASARSSADDLRDRARRAFFRALAVARTVVRQFAVHRVAELRKSRAAVHEMIDSLTEERFSLLGLTAIQDFDPYTFQHSVHVSVLSLALGQELGLPRRDLADLGVAALFHDIGKIHVPKDVLQKPGGFDSSDWAVMKTHPLAGARALLRYGGSGELAMKVMLVSAEHHMRFDGSGYPRFGSDWSQGLLARIVSLADCYDAMTASRAYMERPFTPDSVVRYMLENAGRLFDPDLLRLFVGKVGLFPVGSLVRLESGELALVVDPPAGVREVDRPRVRLLEGGPDSWRLGEERILAAGPSADPRNRVQAGCHPQDHGVGVDPLLTRHHLEETDAT